jgi:hypothetical protein|tara:strand:- start:5226 stop:5585 length:360 start_codon:yes stop_codon:yes gene_type:complete
MPVEDIAEAIIVMPVEELQILADLINELLKDKLTELQDDVKVGDMVSFEAKKGIVVEGVVTELTNTRAKVSIHSGSGDCSAPLKSLTVTYSAPVEELDLETTDPDNTNHPEEYHMGEVV